MVEDLVFKSQVERGYVNVQLEIVSRIYIDKPAFFSGVHFGVIILSEFDDAELTLRVRHFIWYLEEERNSFCQTILLSIAAFEKENLFPIMIWILSGEQLCEFNLGNLARESAIFDLYQIRESYSMPILRLR